MRSIHRNRTIYGLLTISSICFGLVSRYFLGDILFVKAYVGDALWALMVFFGLGFVFHRWATKTVMLVAILFCFSIEISQLYHAPGIDSLRATRLGGLLLGFNFVWSDLLCYTVGISFGVFAETVLMPARFLDRSPAILHPGNPI